MDGAKGRAVVAYDEAMTRVRAAREDVERARCAVAAAGKVADKPDYWPKLARSLAWPSADEVRAGVEALRDATAALDAARQDLRRVGLRPENWTP